MSKDEPHLIEALPIIPAGILILHVFTERDISSSTTQRILSHLTAIPLDRLLDVSLGGDARFHSREAALSLCRANFLQPLQTTLKSLDFSIFPLTLEDLREIGKFVGVGRLTLVQRGTCAELHKFFDVIAASFPHLGRIDVRCDDAISDEVAVDVIEGLALCPDLRSINVTSNRWRPLTGDDIRQLGHRWPLMEDFCLHQENAASNQPGTPLALLQDLAQVWSRSLRKVSLRFDTAAPIPKGPSVKSKFEKLDSLWVGYSDLQGGDLGNVTDFLVAISPGPLNIVCSYEGLGIVAFAWNVVNVDMHIHGMARSDFPIVVPE